MADVMQPEMPPEANGYPQPMDQAAYPMAQPEPQKAPAEIHLEKLAQLAAMDNVAHLISEDDRRSLGELVKRETQIDDESRSSWVEDTKRAIKRAKQQRDRKTFPWDGASNVNYPIVTTAALQFAARAYPAIIDGPRIVKCAPNGADPAGQKAQIADRVSQHMSYQVLKQARDWEEGFDSLLNRLPIEGCLFRKTHRDPTEATGWASVVVSGLDCIVNTNAKSIDSAPRITHKFPLYPYEIKERQRIGTFLEVEIRLESNAGGGDTEAPEMFLEQHRFYDLDGDSVPEPWIVTVHETSGTVVRIAGNYDIDQALIAKDGSRVLSLPRERMWTKYDFLPDSEGGFYGVGFGHLLEGLTEVINTSINQMMDAGTLQNAGGGFIGSGLQIGKAKIRFRPGEYHTVGATGGSIREAIYSMQHPGPSPVLFQLLSLIIDASKDIAAVQDILVGDLPRNQTATATMAMIEQGLKVYTAIIKRVLRSLKGEFEIIFKLNKRYLDHVAYVKLMDEPVQVTQGDYQGEMDISPIADPKMGTDMQRMAKVQFMLERQQSPFVNPFEVERRAWEAFGVDNLQAVLVPPQPNPAQQLQMEGAVADVQTKKAGAIKATVEAQQAMRKSDQDAFREQVDGELAGILGGEQQTTGDAQVNEMGMMQ